MKVKRLVALATVLLTLAGAVPARSQDSETITGVIEAIEKDGRLRINGHQIRVDEDTDLTDTLNRKLKPVELVVGINVEVSYEQTSKGEHASRVIATLVR
jgi:maltose-binding protein MalE